MNIVHPRAMKLLWVAVLLLVSVFAIIFRFSANTSQAASRQGDGAALWQDVAQAELNGVIGERWVQPLAARGLRLNRTALAQLLATAPVERTPAAQEKQVLISIPLPTGRMSRFELRNLRLWNRLGHTISRIENVLRSGAGRSYGVGSV